MLKITSDENRQIVTVEPDGALEASDFQRLDDVVDPIIATKGGLSGLLIHAKQFPGWQSFSDFLAHTRFLRDHLTKVSKVALVTDSPAAELAQVVSRFVSTDVRHFHYDKLDDAVAWLEARA